MIYDLIVIGSGPAGITAAHYLSLKGYRATIFEAEPERFDLVILDLTIPGGMGGAETVAELRKVTWPTRKETSQATIVVIITSVIFAFYLWMADIVIIKLYEGIIRVLG